METKTYTLNLTLVESITFQLKQLLRDSDITETDFKYLAYVHVYPDTYDKMLLKDKISVSKQSIAQKISTLGSTTVNIKDTKLKIIVGTKGVKRKTLLPLIANLLIKDSCIIITNVNIN